MILNFTVNFWSQLSLVKNLSQRVLCCVHVLLLQELTYFYACWASCLYNLELTKPWMTQVVENARKKKNLLYQCFYKTHKNKLRNIRNHKEKHYHSGVSHSKHGEYKMIYCNGFKKKKTSIIFNKKIKNFCRLNKLFF